MEQTKVSVRDLFRLIGRMTATVIPASLCYRNLQRLKNQAFARSQSFETKVTLDQPAKAELKWWVQEVQEVERMSDPTSEPRYDSGDRCVSPRIGSDCEWNKYSWAMVYDRTRQSHQPSGIDGGSICSRSICEKQTRSACQIQNGQQDSNMLYQSHGGGGGEQDHTLPHTQPASYDSGAFKGVSHFLPSTYQERAIS